MCDFHIDSENEIFNNHDKFNNFCDTFSLAKLVEDHTCFTKKHKFSIDLLLANQKLLLPLIQTRETRITGEQLLVSTFAEFAQDPKRMLLEGTKSLTERKQWLPKQKLKLPNMNSFYC